MARGWWKRDSFVTAGTEPESWVHRRRGGLPWPALRRRQTRL